MNVFDDYSMLITKGDWLLNVEKETIRENIYNRNHGVKVLQVFSDNPYRLLGIPADMNIYDVDCKYDKLIKKLALDIEIRTDFDMDVLGEINRDLGTLQTALYEIQHKPYGLAWFKKPYLNDSLFIDSSQKRVFSSNYDINNFEYDEFVVTFVNIVLNDPLCNYIYHWLYILRLITLMYSAKGEYWDNILRSRTQLLLGKISVEEMKNNFITYFLGPITRLLRGAIDKKNIRSVTNWFYILSYSSLETQFIEDLIIGIKDCLDDIAEDIYEEIDKFFKDVVCSKISPNANRFSVTSLDEIRRKMYGIEGKLRGIFAIIPKDTQKGKRVRKPLATLLNNVAGIYYSHGCYAEHKIINSVAGLCSYDS